MNRHMLQALSRPSSKASRLLSSEAASSSSALSFPAVPVDMDSFHYPKAKAMFEKITNKLTKEQIPILSKHMTTNILGRPMRQREFYYHGFGSGSNKRGSASHEEATAAPVKTTVDVKLVGFDATMKLKVIKEIRALGGLGLKEAKELVEGAPKTVQKGLSPEAAEELKLKLEAVGGVIELA
ncbi:hypothetical protein MPSEU_000435100 [Mayamaea pseudoterrestris]|nr:hypothetical protein MPSEU_000435100 [Mayamaea pseudoterrestris]